MFLNFYGEISLDNGSRIWRLHQHNHCFQSLPSGFCWSVALAVDFTWTINIVTNKQLIDIAASNSSLLKFFRHNFTADAISLIWKRFSFYAVSVHVIRPSQYFQFSSYWRLFSTLSFRLWARQGKLQEKNRSVFKFVQISVERASKVCDLSSR